MDKKDLMQSLRRAEVSLHQQNQQHFKAMCCSMTSTQHAHLSDEVRCVAFNVAFESPRKRPSRIASRRW